MPSLAVHGQMKVPVERLTFANKPEVNRIFYLEEPNKSNKNTSKFRTIPIRADKAGIKFGGNTTVTKVFGQNVENTGSKVAVFEKFETFCQNQQYVRGKERVDRKEDKISEYGLKSMSHLTVVVQNWLLKGGEIDASLMKYIRETPYIVMRPQTDSSGKLKAFDESSPDTDWEVYKENGKVKTIGDYADISIDIVESNGAYYAQLKLAMRERSITLVENEKSVKYKPITFELISGEIKGDAVKKLTTAEGIQDIIELADKDPDSKHSLESKKVWEESIVNGDHRGKIIPAMERSWKAAKEEFVEQFKPLPKNLNRFQRLFLALNRMLPETFRLDEKRESVSLFSSLAMFTFALPIILLNFIWRVFPPIKLVFSAISYAYLSLLAHPTLSDWSAEPSKTEKFKLLLIGMLKGVGLMVLWPLSQFGQIISKFIGSPIQTRSFAIKEGLDTEAGSEKGVFKKLINRYKVGQILGGLAVGMTMFFTIGPVILSALAAMTPIGWVFLGIGSLSLLVLIGQAIYGGIVKPSGESPAVGVVIKEGKSEITLDSKNRIIMYLLAKIQDDTSNEGADKDTIFRKFVENLAHNTSEEVRELLSELTDLQEQLLLELKNGDTTLGVKVFGADYAKIDIDNRHLYLANQAKLIRFFQLCYTNTPEEVLKIEKKTIEGLDSDKQLIREMKEVIAKSYSVFEEKMSSGQLSAHYPILKKSREIFSASNKVPKGDKFASDKQSQKYLAMTKKFSKVLKYTVDELKASGKVAELEIFNTPKLKESDDEYTNLLQQFEQKGIPKRRLSLVPVGQVEEIREAPKAPAIDAQIMQEGFDRARSKALGLESFQPRDFKYFNALTKLAKDGDERAMEQLYMLKADYIKSLSEYVKIIERKLVGVEEKRDLSLIKRSSPAFQYFANYLNVEQIDNLYSAVKFCGEICRQFIAFEVEELPHKAEVIKLQQEVDKFTKNKEKAGRAEDAPYPELTKAEEELSYAKEELTDLQEDIQKEQRQILKDISWFELMRSEHLETFAEKKVLIEEEEVIEEEEIIEDELIPAELPPQESLQDNRFPFAKGIRWPGQQEDEDDNLFN